MINDYTVTIVHKNKKLKEVGRTVHSLTDYTSLLSDELKYCLGNIENSFREMLGEDCDLKDNEAFSNIRRQLLNVANGIARLPDTMAYQGTPIKAIKASEYIADTINRL